MGHPTCAERPARRCGRRPGSWPSRPPGSRSPSSRRPPSPGRRQTEFAAGTAPWTSDTRPTWVLPGGLHGMFVDHAELMQARQGDPKQYYKAEPGHLGLEGQALRHALPRGRDGAASTRSSFDAKGVKHPHKDWTYDDFLDACRRLNDPASGKWAVQVGQNGIHYMMGTFMLNFGGKRLNEAKDKALYGDDAKRHPRRRAGRGPPPELRLHAPRPRRCATVPQRKFPMEIEMVAMEFNGRLPPPRHPRRHRGRRTWTSPRRPGGRAGVQTAGGGRQRLVHPQPLQGRGRRLGGAHWLHTREGLLVAAGQARVLAARDLLRRHARSGSTSSRAPTMMDCAEVWRRVRPRSAGAAGGQRRLDGDERTR